MKYYFVANIKIRNFEEYQKYLAEVDSVFETYNGKYLAVDTEPTLIEGNYNYSRTVLIEFNSRSDFENWYYSEEYQKILKFRLSSSECDSILIKGLSN